MRAVWVGVLVGLLAAGCAAEGEPQAAETVTVTETVDASPAPAETVTVTEVAEAATTPPGSPSPSGSPTAAAEPDSPAGEELAVLESAAVVDESVGEWVVLVTALVGNDTGSWVEDVDVQIVARDADGALLGTYNETHYNIAAPGQDLVFAGSLYVAEPPAQPVELDVRVRDEGQAHRDPGFAHGQPDPVTVATQGDDGDWVAELTNPMPFTVADQDLIVMEVYRDADGTLLGADGIMVTEEVAEGATYIVDSDWESGTVDTATPSTVDLYVYFSGDADQLYGG